MVCLMDKKSKKPIVINLLFKRKKNRYDEYVHCEMPGMDYFCPTPSVHFRSVRMAVCFITLVFYCMTLVFLLKNRLSTYTPVTNLWKNQELQHIAKRNHKIEEVRTMTLLQNETTTASAVVESDNSIEQSNDNIELTNSKMTSSNRYIASVSQPQVIKRSMSAFGSWMKDPTSSDDVIYVMDHYFRNTHILAFKNMKDFTDDVVSNDYELPIQWGGTGHAVYDQHLYFNRYNTSTICKYSFEKREIVEAKNIPGAGFGNTSPYQWAGSTDIDFAVDEDGLWVIYATEKSKWNIVVGKLNTDTLEVKKSWTTNFKKRSAGNAFMVNSILYTLHRYDSPSTMLNYAFDTKSSTYSWPKVPFEISYGSVASLDYNHREKKLYAWDRSHQVTYDVTFK